MADSALTYRVKHFLSHGLWQPEDEASARLWVWSRKALRIFFLALRNFVRERCALRASALTFYSLLSIVPVAALAFGFAKGFGLEERLVKEIYEWLPGQTAAVERIIDFARSLLDNTRGGLIAGVGLIVLFWSVIKVLGQIEAALNDIWKVKKRTLLRQFTDYLTVIIICPVLMILSGSITVFIKTQLTDLTSSLALTRVASPLIVFGFKLAPFVILWVLFILIYLVMPNTRVRFKSALIGGIIGGTLYQMVQGFYIGTQMVVAKYNAIYGSFAALPLFLIWLQLSWIIVLLGAQMAHAHGWAATNAIGGDYQGGNQLLRKQCALQIMSMIVRRFEQGLAAADAAQIARQLRLPLALVENLLQQLVAIGMLSVVETSPEHGVPAYQPARDIAALSVALLLEAWDDLGSNPISPQAGDPCEPAVRSIAELYGELRRSPANRLIKDI